MGEHWLICKCTTRRRSLGLVVWLWGIDGHKTMVLRRFDVIQCHEEWIDDTFIHIDLEDGQLDLISTISMSRGIEYLRSWYHALLDTRDYHGCITSGWTSTDYVNLRICTDMDVRSRISTDMWMSHLLLAGYCNIPCNYNLVVTRLRGLPCWVRGVFWWNVGSYRIWMFLVLTWALFWVDSNAVVTWP